MTSRAPEVRYFVLPDATNPEILARVRYPDVFEAISPARPTWQQDPGLFDLPHDPASVPIAPALAEAIARAWGVRLEIEIDDDPRGPGSALMRRMPANWSDLSRAEQRAWSVEFSVRRNRSWPLGRSLRRRPPAEGVVSPTIVLDEVIDLTEPAVDADTTGEES